MLLFREIFISSATYTVSSLSLRRRQLRPAPRMQIRRQQPSPPRHRRAIQTRLHSHLPEMKYIHCNLCPAQNCILQSLSATLHEQGPGESIKTRREFFVSKCFNTKAYKISKAESSVSKFNIVPDIEAQYLSFNIEVS